MASCRNPLFLIGLVVLIFATATGCEPLSQERRITTAFAQFISMLQSEDYSGIDRMTHPDSPFLQSQSAPEHRMRYWKSQHMRLTLVTADIVVLGTTKNQEQQRLRYRWSPSDKTVQSGESIVDFKKHGEQWMLFIPEKGIDVVPTTFGRMSIEQTFPGKNNEGASMNFHVTGQTDGGFSKEKWEEILKQKAKKKNETKTQAPPSKDADE